MVLFPFLSSASFLLIITYYFAGLLSLASHGFLFVITQAEEVARLFDKQVYVITGIAVIPLSSQEEAANAINEAWRKQTLPTTTNDGDSNDDIDDDEDDERDEEEEQSDLDEDACASKDDEWNPRSSTPFQDTDVESQSGEPDQLTSTDETDQRQDVPPTPTTSANIAEDVFSRKPRYLKFASRWFTKPAWASDASDDRRLSGQENAKTNPFLTEPVPARKKPNGLGSSDDMVELDGLTAAGEKQPQSTSIVSPNDQRDRPAENTLTKTAPALLPKLLKYTAMILSARDFYFSYEHDLTRKLAVQDSPSSSVPLFRRADPEFFWNRHMMQPFAEQSQHGLVLPLIQGFIGQKEITARKIVQEQMKDDNNKPDTAQYLLTLISRRSTKRPGLRYLRRGVDDDGNVANMVETEQIVSHPDWDPRKKVYSLLLVRGSIPLYFSQSPYSLKPTPVLRDSTEANRTSFDLHMHSLSRKYGKIQAVCLADKHGVEKPIGEKYQEFAQDFNDRGQKLAGEALRFEWFDFHHECRGMKFENSSHLVEALKEVIDCYGCSIYQNNAVSRTQTGILRINCIDCLDRTGVMQTAFGQYAFQKQLESEGYKVSLESSEVAAHFNTLWADNGDAISKQYSSTAALKGDYTRTGKRNVRGALNDFGLTLSRYFNNAVIDFFSQACIDYLLGNVSERVFDEFEAKMMSTDPGISVERVHQNAIDICCRTVLGSKVPLDSEEFVGGWTVLCPSESNTLRSQPFYQCILLLTNTAVYCCKYDWNADKVIGIRRVEVENISVMTYGTYITSTLTQAEMDPAQNVGVIISYKADPSNPESSESSSLSSHNTDNCSGDTGENGSSFSDKQSRPKTQLSGSHKEWDFLSFFQSNKRQSSSFLAFKILPCSMSVVKNDSILQNVSATDTARMVCEEVERMSTSRQKSDCIGQEKSINIREADIISLEEAKKRTGILEVLAFDLKKLVWA